MGSGKVVAKSARVQGRFRCLSGAYDYGFSDYVPLGWCKRWRACHASKSVVLPEGP